MHYHVYFTIDALCSGYERKRTGGVRHKGAGRRMLARNNVVPSWGLHLGKAGQVVAGQVVAGSPPGA